MPTPKPNASLKSILSSISSHANQGRITLDWSTITEGKKRKSVKEAGEKPKPDENELPELPTDEPKGDSAGGLPDLESPKGGAEDGAKPEAPASEDPIDGSTEDVGEASAEAEKAKAELEKAKAEKNQAEEELEQNAYVKLNSPAGTSFLLGKLLDKAFKTNTMDSLASEFVNKLKITNADDFNTFSSDMTPFKNLIGMPEFLQSVKSLASSNKPAASED